MPRANRVRTRQSRPRSEDAAAPHAVAGAPGQHEQTAERQDVRVDDPRSTRSVEVELGRDRGQGDPDDGGVEDDRELCGGQQREDARRVPLRRGRHRRPFRL